MLFFSVSQDPNAIYFATNYQADIVISSSAINCLIENLTDPYLEWEIPITIKSIQERKYCLRAGDILTFKFFEETLFELIQ